MGIVALIAWFRKSDTSERLALLSPFIMYEQMPIGMMSSL